MRFPDWLALTTAGVWLAVPQLPVHAAEWPSLKSQVARIKKLSSEPQKFPTNLIGSLTFEVDPVLVSELVSSQAMLPGRDGQLPIVNTVDWELKGTYARAVFHNFLTPENELAAQKKELRFDDDVFFILQNKATKRLYMASLEGKPENAVSPIRYVDGSFGDDFGNLQPFQFYRHYPTFTDFYDTCVPFRQQGISYILCRELYRPHPFPVGPIRYGLFIRLRDDLGALRPGIAKEVVAEIKAGRIPGTFFPGN
jgi:hypothetical protein